MERMRKGSLEVIMMMMMRRRRSRRGSITMEVKMIVLPDHDHDRSGSIERAFINTSITTYAGKEAKTGLLICLFRQSCGSSENTLDHRT